MEKTTAGYAKFYVKRKGKLFPLIEKYTGEKISSKTPHGKAIGVYYAQLKNNPAFKQEVDAIMLSSGFKNADDTTTDEKPGLFKPGGFFTGILGAAGGIIDTVNLNKQAELESDKMFYQTVLNSQQQDDTKKLLIVSGVTIAIIGVAVFFVLKYKKG